MHIDLHCSDFGCVSWYTNEKSTPAAVVPPAGGRPLLPGKSDIDQLGLVGRLYGGLTPRLWPGITAAPDYGVSRQ